MNATFSLIDSEQIVSLLQAAFQPQVLTVVDEASKHAGHAHGGAGHFKVEIQSHMFNGKTRVQTHRMIYEILEPFMNNGIHALSIDAKPG